MGHRKLAGDGLHHPDGVGRAGSSVALSSNGCQSQPLSPEGPSKAKEEVAITTTDKVVEEEEVKKTGKGSNSSSHQRPTKTSSVPCRFFQRGYCRYGESCRFQHSPSAALTSAAAGISNPKEEEKDKDSTMASEVEEEKKTEEGGSRPENTSSVPCRFFQRGYCRYGESCRFRHSASDASNSIAAGPSNPKGKASAKGKVSGCLHWLLAGSCERGSKCRYAHPENPGKVSEGLENMTVNPRREGIAGFDFMTSQFSQNGCNLGSSSEDDDDEVEQRMRNCGFTDDDVYELSLQGIKPWDPEAWDALAVLSGAEW